MATKIESPSGRQGKQPDKLHQLNEGGERAIVKMETTAKNHIIKQNWTKVSKKINKVLF